MKLISSKRKAQRQPIRPRLRFTKKTRDEAAIIAAVGSAYINDDTDEMLYTSSSDAYLLYLAAFNFVMLRLPHGTILNTIDAETEALIRTGWTP